MSPEETDHTHIISVLVENEFGVLARVAGMFAGRGFNIDALSVAPTPDPQISRITLTTRGNEQIIEQILKQLNRLIDVSKVIDLSSEDCVRRELVLIKVRSSEKDRAKIIKKAKELSGRVLDETDSRIILEFIEEPKGLKDILTELKDFGIVETVRTGNIAIQKGKKTLTHTPD